MPTPGPSPTSDADIFAPSAKGTLELKIAGTSLSATELQLLVLVDGVLSVGEIAQGMPGVARGDVDTALRKLAAGKLIVATADLDDGNMGSGFSTISIPAGFFSGLATDANPAADAGLASLKKKGYFVHIAQRPAAQPELKEGWRPIILVIDDDPDLQKLIRTYLTLEGFNPRAALKGADIVIALRQPPPPDLILLDVQLPDANGFDILAKFRLHPVLKNMPVIMLTAEASREAVLKGLRGGANGYVTKPFEADMLINAGKAVLGLSAPAAKKK